MPSGGNGVGRRLGAGGRREAGHAAARRGTPEGNAGGGAVTGRKRMGARQGRRSTPSQLGTFRWLVLTGAAAGGAGGCERGGAGHLRRGIGSGAGRSTGGGWELGIQAREVGIEAREV